MCFIQTLVIACTVSAIFAQIDQKDQNCTFVTVKITFIVIQHHDIIDGGISRWGAGLA